MSLNVHFNFIEIAVHHIPHIMSTLDFQNMNRPKGDKQKFCMKD